MHVAQAIIWGVTLYAVAGVIFSVAFTTRGAGRIDPAARHVPIGFRLLIAPGAAALWPVLLRKWLRAGRETGA